MQYFVIQVSTGKEDLFTQLFEKQRHLFGGDLFTPKRELIIYRQKKKVKTIQPLFPGYIFWYGETDFIADYINFKTLGQFFRALGDESGPRPLNAQDQELLRHFMQFGSVLGVSKLIFNEHDRVVIKDGPLLGLEGHITKVDKRRGRARIKLDMYNSSYEVDFAFEVIKPSTKEKIGP